MADRRRARRPGQQKALSAAQEEALRYLIARDCDHHRSGRLRCQRARRCYRPSHARVGLAEPAGGRPHHFVLWSSLSSEQAASHRAQHHAVRACLRTSATRHCPYKDHGCDNPMLDATAHSQSGQLRKRRFALVVTPRYTTQVVTPMLRKIVSSGVFENPAKPFLTTRCSPCWGARSSTICAPQVPSTTKVRLPPGVSPIRQ